MIKNIFAACFLLFLLGSCEGLPAEENSVAEEATYSTLNVDSLATEPEYRSKVLQERIPGWVSYQQEQNPEFDPARFVLQDTSIYKPVTSEFYPDRTFREFYGNLLVYNNDSSRIVDLYSYRFAMEKDGQGNLRIHESPDTEVAVIIPGHNRKERIMFMGPIGAYDHAFWVDDRHILVAGNVDEEGLGKRSPILWLINYRAKKIYNFTYQKELKNTARGYQLFRLRNKGMLETPPPA